MAESQGMKYYDASAKENINIDTFMKDLMNQVYTNKFGGSVPQRETIKINKKNAGVAGAGTEGSSS